MVNALYVQDDYWLLVQAPHEQQGGQTGQFYDLAVELASFISATQPLAVLYVERTVDELIVLDRSSSMAVGGRLVAAQNAAVLMTTNSTRAIRAPMCPTTMTRWSRSPWP